VYLNSIARSVFALAMLSGSARACQNVAADCDAANPIKEAIRPRVWTSEDGHKYILNRDGYLMRKPQRITNENIAQYAALAAVTALDWHGTKRMVANGRGREGNPLIASGNHASATRFSIMSGVAAGMWLLHDLYLKPRALAEGKTESKSVRIIRWSMVAGRTAIVINNYAR